MKKNRKTARATQSIRSAMTQKPRQQSALQKLRGFVRRAATIDQPDQERTDRHPGQLVPIEKRKAEQRRFLEIVERHPQQADERHEQKDPHGPTPALSRRLGRRSLNGTI